MKIFTLEYGLMKKKKKKNLQKNTFTDQLSIKKNILGA